VTVRPMAGLLPLGIPLYGSADKSVDYGE